MPYVVVILLKVEQGCLALLNLLGDFLLVLSQASCAVPTNTTGCLTSGRVDAFVEAGDRVVQGSFLCGGLVGFLALAGPERPVRPVGEVAAEATFLDQHHHAGDPFPGKVVCI